MMIRSVHFSTILCIGWVSICSVWAFNIQRPEILMVEPGFQANDQLNTSVTFDSSGHVHVVYTENRTGTQHIYARTLMADNTLTDSYRAYLGIEGNAHIFPFVLPSSYYTNRVNFGGLDTFGTNFSCVTGYMDTTGFPAIPTPVNGSSIMLSTPNAESFEVLCGGFFIFYAYHEYPNIYLNAMDEQVQIWQTETVISPISSEESFSNPRLAMDDAGYIYLTYSVYNNNLFISEARIRRSNLPYNVSAGFTEERFINNDSEGAGFDVAVAATGDYGLYTLKVAVAYSFPSSTVTKIIGDMEPNFDWTATVPIPPFSGSGPYDISSSLSSTIQQEGPDIAFDANDDLYIIWSDNRDLIYKIYGNMSYDSGVTMLSSNEVQIGIGIEGIYGVPQLTTGPEPGDIAIAYTRNTGTFINPYLLLTRATFFDSCNVDPALTGYWDAYAGVSISSEQFVSPDYSYKFTPSRGELLRDFGAIEQQGTVTFQFFDTLAPDHFHIALENDNGRGVIRMLGVRNETTPTNYAYSPDGVNWYDLGAAARTLGWHEFRLNVNNDGLAMSISLYGGGLAQAPIDPSFTGFTSVSMEMTGGTGAYYVDDIRVETYPLISGPPPVPILSPIGIIVLLLGAGILVRRTRSY
ncbi:hypothetical protein JXA80_08025 [bacterium]|nr:hypothetical protein [candidate division CSSED10-310 bacterium]